jgi:GNAT superfamily N-acetyltransferase
MGRPVSVRLDEKVQTTLEDAARERGIGLSTYLRELAADEARRIRRERIRAQSRAVGTYVASSPEARAFYEDWGTPSPETEPR